MKSLHTFLLCALAACGDGRTELGTIRDIATLDSGSQHDAGNCTDAIIATDKAGTTTLAVDGEVVFWGTGDGQVWRREAGNASELAKESSAISTLAVDSTSLYFTAGSTVYSGVRSIGIVSQFTSANVGVPIDMAVDSQSLFILDAGNGTPNTTRLLSIDKATKAMTVLTKLDASLAIALDDLYVYVAGPRGIVRISKMGGSLAQGIAQLGAGALALDATRVFFLETGGGLRSVPKAGGPVTTIADTGKAMLFGIAIDSTHAYVTLDPTASASPQGVIRRIALDGSTNDVWAHAPAPLFSTQVRMGASAVYWTNAWMLANPPPDGAPTAQRKCK